MNFSHDRFESMAKCPVTIATAKAPLSGESFKGQATCLAGNLVLRSCFSGAGDISHQIRQDLGQRKRYIVQRRMKSSRCRTLLAQMQGRFLIVCYLREMNLRFSLFAVLAEHISTTCFLNPFVYFAANYLKLTVAFCRQFPVMRGYQQGHIIVGVEAE